MDAAAGSGVKSEVGLKGEVGVKSERGDGGGGAGGVDSALGRIGDRTVDSVAKLRKSDRFKNQMVGGPFSSFSLFVLGREEAYACRRML